MTGLVACPVNLAARFILATKMNFLKAYKSHVYTCMILFFPCRDQGSLVVLSMKRFCWREANIQAYSERSLAQHIVTHTHATQEHTHTHIHTDTQSQTHTVTQTQIRHTQSSRSRFLRRLRSDLTRSLLISKNELGAT